MLERYSSMFVFLYPITFCLIGNDSNLFDCTLYILFQKQQILINFNKSKDYIKFHIMQAQCSKWKLLNLKKYLLSVLLNCRPIKIRFLDEHLELLWRCSCCHLTQLLLNKTKKDRETIEERLLRTRKKLNEY